MSDLFQLISALTLLSTVIVVIIFAANINLGGLHPSIPQQNPDGFCWTWYLTNYQIPPIYMALPMMIFCLLPIGYVASFDLHLFSLFLCMVIVTGILGWTLIVFS